MLRTASLFVTLTVGYGAAQEIEGVTFGQVVATAPSALHAQPSLASPAMATIPKNTTLRWVEGQKVKGFYRVMADRGGVGWISAGNIKEITAVPATGVIESTTPPCVASLAACADTGCAADGSPHALFNQFKRRVPAPRPPLGISFDDLASLQSQSDSLIGQGRELTASDREQLTNLQVASGTAGEGTLVELVGFISSGPLSPHPNTGESVNCNLKGPANNDFHISFNPDPSGTEFTGIVIEMIPQDRPDAWTLAQLKKAQQQSKQILVRGALFYDNEHVVNSDPNNDLPGQPRRFALWEIHPITEFLVCMTSSCDPSQPDQWIAFADFN